MLRLNVSFQISLCAERQLTILTNLQIFFVSGQRFSVNFYQMPNKSTFGHKSLVALGAIGILASAVSIRVLIFHVGCQIYALGENSWALFTLERFYLLVNRFDVNAQASSGAE